MKFRHHIPYGSEVVAYKHYKTTFCHGHTIQQLKIKGYRFFIPHCLDEIYLSGIFTENCINLSQAVVELCPYIHKLAKEEGTDRQTRCL